MSKLLTFYEKVIKSIGYEADAEGFIRVANGKKSDLVKIGDKFLVLPTKDQIANMTRVEDGVVHTTKVLFNPLKEDIVKGDSESLKKIKTTMEVKLSFTAATIFELLLKLGGNQELQKKASLDVNSFIGTLKEARGTNVREVIDEGSLDRWGKLYQQCIKPTSTKGLLHMFIKKGGVVNDVKYNRLSNMGFPMYRALSDMGPKDKNLYGVTLRTKDIKVLKLIYEYVFLNIDTPEYYMLGSMDTNSPGFVSLFKLYLTVGNRFNEILNSLDFMKEEIIDIAKLDLDIDFSELDNTAKFAGEIALIPVDNDTSAKSTSRLLGSQQEAPKATEVVNPTKPKLDPRALLNGTYNQQPVYTPPPNVPVPQVDTTGMTAAQKILYGNNPSLVQPVNPQEPRPMGINNMPVPQPQPYYPQQQGYPQAPGMYPNMGGYPPQSQYNNYNQPRPMGINSMGGYR